MSLGFDGRPPGGLGLAVRRPLPWFAAALLSGAFALGACGKEQSGPALDAGSDGGGGSAPAIRVDFAEGSSVASQVGFLNSLNVFEVLDPSVVPEVLQRLQEDPALGVRRAIEDTLDPERLRVDEGALSVLETLAPGLWKAGGRTLVPACLSLRHAELDTVVHVELYDWWIQVDQAGRVLAKDPLQDPDTWQQWASRVREAAEQVAAARCEPAVYNVWGEPDNFWDNDATPLVYDPDDPTGPPRNFDRDHFYQLFADTEELLEQVHSELGLPPPRMAGPNTAAYREDWLQGLLDVVVARGAHLDVVSWHELGRESEFPNVVEHVADATRRIRAAGLPVPPVHVSETLNGVYTFAPGSPAWPGSPLERTYRCH